MNVQEARLKIDNEAKAITLELYNMSERKRIFKKRLTELQQQGIVLNTLDIAPPVDKPLEPNVPTE